MGSDSRDTARSGHPFVYSSVNDLLIPWRHASGAQPRTTGLRLAVMNRCTHSAPREKFVQFVIRGRQAGKLRMSTIGSKRKRQGPVSLGCESGPCARSQQACWRWNARSTCCKYPGRDSNSYSTLVLEDFESSVSTDSTTRAWLPPQDNWCSTRRRSPATSTLPVPRDATAARWVLVPRWSRHGRGPAPAVVGAPAPAMW